MARGGRCARVLPRVLRRRPRPGADRSPRAPTAAGASRLTQGTMLREAPLSRRSAAEEPRKAVRADVAAGQHDADPLAATVDGAAQQRGERARPAGFEDELEALEAETHRLEDLLVGDGHRRVDAGADHRPGELARRL